MQPVHSLPPGFADLLVSKADEDPRLKAVLDDYEEACTRSSDGKASSEERAEWAEIRDELKNELMRFAKRLNQDQQRKCK